MEESAEKTIVFWSKRKGKEFSQEEAREAVANIAGFFQTLSDWASKIQDTRAQGRAISHVNRRRRRSGSRAL